MNPKLKKVLDTTIPLILIVGFTLAACYLYFYDGLLGGDDIRFHLGNIYDVYYGMKHGLSIDSSNHIYLGAYAYNTHVFYAPFPHYFAAIIMLIFNVDTVVALKISITFFCFIGILFFYLFSYRISKRRSVAVLGAAIFAFGPYRMFCGLCRFAYAETIAMSIMPILFYGIYAITHDETPKYRSFLMVIVGISLLVLSHPFTALISVIFALIYMAIRYKNVIAFVKNKKGLILSISTVVLVLGLVGFYFFPMLEAESSGLYRISDSTAVWTNYQHVANSTANSWQFSGFLNLTWLNSMVNSGKFPETYSASSLLLGVGLVIISAILVAVGDHFIKKLPYSKYYRIPVVILISAFPIIFTIQRLEVYLALLMFDITYLAVQFFDEKKVERERNGEKVAFDKDVFKDVIYLGLSLLILLLFIFVGDVWYIVPDIFYTCQFAWRLWSLFYLYLSWIIVIGLNALSEYKNQIGFICLASVPFIFFTAAQEYPEKRGAMEEESAGAYVHYTYGDKEVMQTSNVGVMNEYIPLVFYEEGYESEYSNSLYNKIRSTIGNYRLYQYTIDKYIKPAFLEGDGDLTITEFNTPNVSFDAIVNIDNSLIQLPQFYYKGYYAEFVDKDTNEVIDKVECGYVDGLVSFRAQVGEYKINVYYKGSNLRVAFNIVFFVTLPFVGALAVLSGFEFYQEKIKAKKPQIEN